MDMLRSIAISMAGLSLLASACERKEGPTEATPQAEVAPVAPTPPAEPVPAPTPVASAAATQAATAAPVQPALPAAAPATYEIDVSHSRVGFSVKHLMVSNTRGSFKKFGGAVHVDETDPSKSTVAVDIDAASIDTADAKRDEHLRSPDFLDVKKFPKLTFKSTQVERSGAGYAVSGELTLHGVTKPVTLAVDSITPEVTDPWGSIRRGAHASTKINRKDFGLNWNKALEAGGVVVGDDVTIELELELKRAKS